MKRTKPSIHSYHDYRVFLKDWITYRQREDPKLSLRYLAKQAELSVAYLSMILSGSRNFSNEALTRILPFLKLDVTEETYLRLLRTIADSESHEERQKALELIQGFSIYKDINSKETEVYRYLSHWYNVAIREM